MITNLRAGGTQRYWVERSTEKKVSRHLVGERMERGSTGRLPENLRNSFKTKCMWNSWMFFLEYLQLHGWIWPGLTSQSLVLVQTAVLIFGLRYSISCWTSWIPHLCLTLLPPVLPAPLSWKLWPRAASPAEHTLTLLASVLSLNFPSYLPLI